MEGVELPHQAGLPPRLGGGADLREGALAHLVAARVAQRQQQRRGFAGVPGGDDR